jgi:hypothetical protein
MARTRPWVANRTVALIGGIALTLAGSLLLYDAYEHRGTSRPFALRFLPS